MRGDEAGQGGGVRVLRPARGRGRARHAALQQRHRAPQRRARVRRAAARHLLSQSEASPCGPITAHLLVHAVEHGGEVGEADGGVLAAGGLALAGLEAGEAQLQAAARVPAAGLLVQPRQLLAHACRDRDSIMKENSDCANSPLEHEDNCTSWMFAAKLSCSVTRESAMLTTLASCPDICSHSAAEHLVWLMMVTLRKSERC